MSSLALPTLLTYQRPSGITAEGDRGRVFLAPRILPGVESRFFEGKVLSPALTAQVFSVIGTVASSKFMNPVPEFDPVLTSSRSAIRVEAFSACCGVYVRADLGSDALEPEFHRYGTTNVDFGLELRTALRKVTNGSNFELSIGSEHLSIKTETQSVIEKKVRLPFRWIKGFSELQVMQSEMLRWCEISAGEFRSFLSSLPGGSSKAKDYWIVPAGKGIRLSQQAGQKAIRFAAPGRLKMVEPLLPYVKGVTIFVDKESRLTAWVLDCGPISLTYILSPELWRGFSGEGKLLQRMLDRRGEGSMLDTENPVLARVRASLNWESELVVADAMREFEAEKHSILGALDTLSTSGLLGYDIIKSNYFHRVLPYDAASLLLTQPRLEDAHALVERGGVVSITTGPERIDAEVRGSDTLHRVTIDDDSSKCTCPWYNKHGNERGPCKHLLAVLLKCK